MKAWCPCCTLHLVSLLHLHVTVTRCKSVLPIRVTPDAAQSHGALHVHTLHIRAARSCHTPVRVIRRTSLLPCVSTMQDPVAGSGTVRTPRPAAAPVGQTTEFKHAASRVLPQTPSSIYSSHHLIFFYIIIPDTGHAAGFLASPC
jgi:hypothetical protein